jgi:hypothetical protein
MIGGKRPKRSTIERWTRDCLDVGFLRRGGFLDGGWVTIGRPLPHRLAPLDPGRVY